MTKHIQQARIQRLARAHVRVEEVEEYDDPRMLYAPVALAFTEAEVRALAAVVELGFHFGGDLSQNERSVIETVYAAADALSNNSKEAR